MPVPRDITALGSSAHLCGTFVRQISNPNPGGNRALLARTFHVYLELAMQAKHDQVIRGYCRQVGLNPRNDRGTEFKHGSLATGQQVLAVFYKARASVAAEAAEKHMVTKWKLPQAPGGSVFTKEARVDASVQMQRQSDGNQYEVSYWYDGTDIYVLFHCYPQR